MRLRLFPFLVYTLMAGTEALAQQSHYLDCSAGNDAADSLTPATAWRSVEKASSFIYQPGDSLLLRRGSRCEGMLWPKGSGTAEKPIHLGAYGQGALPIIVGGTEQAGVRLQNQQYWEMENLEVIGGSPYGIHIGGGEPVLRHFRVTNAVVHDVTGKPTTKDSGLVVIAPDARALTRIEDVTVDGVTAYGSSQWAGILVSGAGFDANGQMDHGDHVEVRNSIVHDVAGDGILLARVSHGVIEHNAAWFTGMQETETIGTPNSIWEWRCSDCRVEYNEGFFSDSPGVDGGIFDIDYGDEDNLVAHNFGHDSQGYCVSVFGAEGASGDSVRSTLLENTCIHNGRSPRLAMRQGAIFLYTWNGGRLNGVTIKHNTVVWDPEFGAPAFQSTAEFKPDLPRRFVGNTIVSLSGGFASSATPFEFAENRYCGRAAGAEADPQAGHPEPVCTCLSDIAAGAEGTSHLRVSLLPQSDAPNPTSSRASHNSRWTLLGVLDPPGMPFTPASRSQMVLMESMVRQFGDLGLAAAIVPAHPIDLEQLEQWRTDWNASASIQFDAADSRGVRKAYPHSDAPLLLLVAPNGEVAAQWQYPVPPASVWLAIESRLGTPRGTQQMPACKSHGRE